MRAIESSKLLVLLILPFLILGSGFQECPFLGPDFLAPTNLAASSSFQTALSTLKAKIEAGITSGVLAPNSTSFSVELFSIHDAKPLFDFHHAAPNLLSNGTRTIDGDSIYRIASISKLFTVYLWLINAGDVQFHDPITKFIPELARASHLYSENEAADFVDWDSVTIAELASHISGIGRDYFADLLVILPSSTLSPFGFPPVNTSDLVLCQDFDNCGRDQFFKFLTAHHPVFPTATTPVYSNIAFQILGYALESITKKSYASLLRNSLATPLHMGSTFSSPPNDTSHAVLPGTSVNWDLGYQDFTPAGGLYSTAHDLTTLGRSILSSTLISAPLTRRWMKPLTHSATATFSLGAPWEIWRFALPPPSQPRIIDIYTKAGDTGPYHSVLALVPDLGIGYSVLIADGVGTVSDARSVLSAWVNDAFVPATEATAREEAAVNFAGEYKSKNKALNSSLTVTTSPSHNGLGLSSFISNNTDMFTVGGLLLGGVPRANVSIRLYPTTLSNSKKGYGSAVKQVTWRAVFENTGNTADEGFFGCGTWVGADGNMYGNVGVDEILFTLGNNGKALSVEARAFRATLDKI
ncbi:beta-lactamase/transpeptidase-like protein [Halenospora varia]|nr:beta-lactamase/transpeptidase-like protein [Halenospora varia]